MSDFAPSVEAARVALGTSTPIVTNPHPVGADGAKVSLEEVAARIRRGRNDPRVRAWAIRAIKEGGEPRGVKSQAQTLLNALRKVTTYVSDPINSEFMQSAHETLCLDEHGLCFKGGDCDDLCIAYGSAAASIGIPVSVVGQSFATDGVPTHVIVAVQDAKYKEWYRVDPSSKYDVGAYFPATKEVWIDPFDKKQTGDVGAGGDFVGVGRLPEPHVFHHHITDTVMLVGLGDIPATLTVDQSSSIYRTTVFQIQSTLYALQKSINDLQAAFNTIESTRQTLRPDNPYDPEPSGGITSISDAPDGLWTASMSSMTYSIIKIGSYLIQPAQEALQGIRKIFVSSDKGEVYIEATSADPFRLHAVARSATDAVMGWFDANGTLLNGFTASNGQILSTPDAVNQAATAMGGQTGVTGVQGPPQVGVGQLSELTIGVIAATVAFVTWMVTSCIEKTSDNETIRKQADVAEAKARLAIYEEHAKAITAGKMTPDQAAVLEGTIATGETNIKKAEAENKAQDPFTKFTENLGTIVMWMTIGGVVVTGLVLAAPLVRQAAENAALSMKRKRELPGKQPEAAPAEGYPHSEYFASWENYR